MQTIFEWSTLDLGQLFPFLNTPINILIDIDIEVQKKTKDIANRLLID
jgi:hypothetical protein